MRKPAELLVWFSLFSKYGLLGQLALASPQAAVVLQPAIAEQLVEEPLDAAASDDEEIFTVTVVSGIATVPLPTGTFAPQAIPLPAGTVARASAVLAAPVPITPATTETSVKTLATIAAKQTWTARELCTSAPFQLTAKNWRDSGTIDWLKKFSAEWRDQSIYSLYGILGTIAYTYLGRSDYRCEIGTLHSCTVTCQEVANMVPDTHEARNVYFALTAGKHYLQHMESLDKAIQNAGQTVTNWIPQISFSFFWWRHGDYENFLNMIRSMVRTAFVIFAHNSHSFALPMFDLIMAGESTIGQAMRIKAAHDRAQDAYGHWTSFKYATGMYNDQVKSTQMREAVEHISQPFYHPNYVVSRPRKFSDWEGNHHMAQQANVAQVSLYLAEMIQKVRSDHHHSVNRVLQSDMTEPDGNSLFTLVMSAGDFLSPFSEEAKKRTEFIEEKMTNAIKYQVLNLAIRSQTVWIQCTKSFLDVDGHPVPSCHMDTSGPQNLKACVGDRVCYMYKWDDKSDQRDHLAEIMGAENFHKPPFSLRISDIIQSSVLTHIEHIDSAQLNRLWTGKALESIFDPAAPGSFNVPVCIRDGENWNSPLKPYRYFLDDWNPWSSKKNLPCYCGNEWGGSTSHVWHESGLADTAKFNEYRTSYCPSLINSKVETRLERYVALCQLDVRYKNFIQKYGVGRDHFCDYVIDVVTRHGHGGLNHLDPKMRTALECRLGLYDGVKITRANCEMFYAQNEKSLDDRLKSGLASNMPDAAEDLRRQEEQQNAQEDLVGQTEKSEPAHSDWSFLENDVQ